MRKLRVLNRLFVSLFIGSLFISFCFCLNHETIIGTNEKNNVLAINTERNSNTRYVKNLAVFIRFSDSDANVIHHLDDEQSVINAYKIFNSDELFEMDSINGIIKVPSFKKYYEKQSYGSLSITTEIFPKENGRVVSYTDPHPIGYYLKYDEDNTIGYKDKNESLQRETELINNAVSYISNMVSLSSITADELDSNADGVIDAISFIVEGQKNLPVSIGWNELLWSHKRDNTGIGSTILGKNIISYTLLYADDYTESANLFSLNRGTYGTIIHEFGHTLGYMDLYRYGNSSSMPVGFYDIMGNAIGSNPQDFLTYYISEYHFTTNWHNPLPIINKTTNDITVYKPKFIDKNEKRAVKIQIDGNDDEFFVVEYHEKVNTYPSHSADSSGIIIYRVNEQNKYTGNSDGSNQGKGDHVYVFRPNETGLGDGKGNLSEATLNMNRPTFGKDLDLSTNSFDNQSIFFSDGANSGIKIEVTGESNDSITFNVIFPKTDGSGTKEDPYLIASADTFIQLMKLNTKNKYYKLVSDLDFKDINYPIINFEGSLDGNNKTIRNIKTNGSGVFNNIGHYQTHTAISNLTVENITAYSNSGNYLGGFASVADNVTLTNIHLQNGTVTSEGVSSNELASTGGLIGNVYNTVIIDSCSSNLNVRANKNVGGFIGLNMNAKISNSFTSGIVSGNTKVGGFFGIQIISDNVYNVPSNVYYNASVHSFSAVGGYVSPFHNLNVLNEASLAKGITSISIPLELTIFELSKTDLPITTVPNINLTYVVAVQDTSIITYENNKVIGVNIGDSELYTDVSVGTLKMRFTTKVTVKKRDGALTEKDVLDILGLSKKDIYVIGFKEKTNITEVRQMLSNYSSVSLKVLSNQGSELSNGFIGTGMKITFYLNNTEYNYIVVIKGDVNGDGLIYATDYVKVKNHIMGKSTLTNAYLLAADMNNDGNVYATDYVKIKNYIMSQSRANNSYQLSLDIDKIYT